MFEIIVFILIFFILFAVIEVICTHLFCRVFYNVGITVKKISLKTGLNLNLTENQVSKLYEGKYYITGNKIYFISRLRLFSYKTMTPFTFKCIATIQSDGKIDINVKLPIGSSLIFMLFIIGGFIFLLIDTIKDPEPSIEQYIITFFYILVFSVLTAYFFHIEKMRFLKMVEELKKILR